MKENRRWQTPRSKLRERLEQRSERKEKSYYGDYAQDYRGNHFENLPVALTKQLRENMFQKTVAAIIVVICLGVFSLFNTSLTNRFVAMAYQLTVTQTNPMDLVEAAKPVMQSIREFSWRKDENTPAPIDEEVVTSPEGMAAPVNGTLSSPYGTRLVPGSDELEMHYGIDVNAPGGSPVYAAFTGTVTVVDLAHPVYGETIYIQHSDDTVTIYGRVAESVVTAGDQVQKGDVIAQVATVDTAEAGESHLHFEIWQEKQPVNPETFLNQTD
ncbi:MAG: M23 family metallopeptidase [Firmicutes bacterium]|nr:M23 family metallopeptidase [Bacillota bacterium]